ncbi:hypothetical protein C1631_013010 [Chryseobacterium phosphatilyticum]|uniref:Uncharacterized protein n=1 Tax=Chryseobacterium phosphatilyticum TaxID=475075 RepID=A0A316X5A2_9FLAO|nr:hypothetical protein [Chryseobacterium phosphatilyticum]PWN68985.1 hypothetical protein C1631_013010 [Chryseobacterium phosphatilyticum]
MKNLLIIIILFINAQCASQNTTKMNNNNNIGVNITQGQGKNLLNGVVSSILTVTNNSSQDVSILLFYPNPNDLSFTSPSSLVKIKDKQWNDSERSAPIKIAAGKSYHVTYFLNRYFEFLKEGEINVHYNLDLFVATEGGSPKSSAHHGVFNIKVDKGSKEEIQQQILYYQNNLKSEDFSLKKEAEEALLYLVAVSEK